MATVLVTFRVPEEVVEALDKACQRADRTRSWVLRRALLSALSSGALDRLQACPRPELRHE